MQTILIGQYAAGNRGANVCSLSFSDWQLPAEKLKTGDRDLETRNLTSSSHRLLIRRGLPVNHQVPMAESASD